MDELKEMPAMFVITHQAVEYFIKKRFDELGLEKYKEFTYLWMYRLRSTDLRILKLVNT